MRGAAALGGFYIRDQVCLGPAVMNAAAWFERGNWAGIVLTPETAEVWKEYRKSSWNDDLVAGFVWHPYPVPASRAVTERSGENPPLMFGLSWPSHDQEQLLSRDALRAITWKAFAGIYDRIDAERKMRATLEFFDKTCERADKGKAATWSKAI